MTTTKIPTPDREFGGIEDDIKLDDENACGRPCDPDESCEECSIYWDRMENEGYWDRSRHRWTEKGMKEIRK